MSKLVKLTRNGIFEICESISSLYPLDVKKNNVRTRHRFVYKGFKKDIENIQRDFKNAHDKYTSECLNA